MNEATQPRLGDAPPAETRQLVFSTAMAEQALARTRAVLAAGGKLIGREVTMPEVRFDLRGQAAGQFRMEAADRAVIRYNAALFARHQEAFLAQTVPHEVAHYLTFLHFGRGVRPHGAEWQGIMRGLGADPSRCHQFDVSGIATRRVRRYAYHCDCGDHALTSIRHHRVLRGARYLCKRCGQALRAGRAGGDGET